MLVAHGCQIGTDVTSIEHSILKFVHPYMLLAMYISLIEVAQLSRVGDIRKVVIVTGPGYCILFHFRAVVILYYNHRYK